MLLEKFVSCPESRSKLCHGPLARLINGFCFWLQDLGFSHALIYKHLALFQLVVVYTYKRR